MYVGIKVLDVQDANRVLCDPSSVVAMSRQLIGMVVPNTTNECERRLQALQLANEELRHAVSNCVSYASGAGGMMLVKKLCANLGFKKDAATPPPASGRGTNRRSNRVNALDVLDVLDVVAAILNIEDNLFIQIK